MGFHTPFIWKSKILCEVCDCRQWLSSSVFIVFSTKPLLFFFKYWVTLFLIRLLFPVKDYYGRQLSVTIAERDVESQAISRCLWWYINVFEVIKLTFYNGLHSTLNNSPSTAAAFINEEQSLLISGSITLWNITFNDPLMACFLFCSNEIECNAKCNN